MSLNKPILETRNFNTTNPGPFVSKSARMSPLLHPNDILLSIQNKNDIFINKSKTEPSSPNKYFTLDYYKNSSNVRNKNTSSLRNLGNKVFKPTHNSINSKDNLFITPFSSPLFEKDLIRNEITNSKNIVGKSNKSDLSIILPKLNNPSKTKDLPRLSHLKLLPDYRIQNNSHLYPDTSEITPLWKDNLISWCKDSNYQDYMIINKQKNLINVNNINNKLLSNFNELPSSILKPGDQFKELVNCYNSKHHVAETVGNPDNVEDEDSMTPITPPLSPKRSLENLKFTPFVSEKLIQSVKKSSNTSSNSLYISQNTSSKPSNNENVTNNNTTSKKIVKNGHKKTNSFKALQIKKMLYNRDIFTTGMVIRKISNPSVSTNISRENSDSSSSVSDQYNMDSIPNLYNGTTRGQIILKLNNKVTPSSGKFKVNNFSNNNNIIPHTNMGSKNITNTELVLNTATTLTSCNNNINQDTNSSIIANSLSNSNLIEISSHNSTRVSSNTGSKSNSSRSTRSTSPIRNFATPHSRSTSPTRRKLTFQNNSLPKYHKFAVSSRSPSPIRLQDNSTNFGLKNVNDNFVLTSTVANLSHAGSNSTSIPSSTTTSPKRRKSYSTQTVRKCISCQSSDSPCWRPSWSPKKHDQLCNSCGLRYKKTHTRCLNESCKKIPTKGELNIMKSHGMVTDVVSGYDELHTGYRCLFCNSVTETRD